MKIVSIIVSLLVILVGIIFAIKNATPVTLNFVLFSREMPVSLALVLSFALGAILSLIASVLVVLRLKRKVHRLEKSLDREISQTSLSTLTPSIPNKGDQ